jgi:hypothetical protein
MSTHSAGAQRHDQRRADQLARTDDEDGRGALVG